MLRLPLTHPGLLGALARAGHGSRVLVADGNYPMSNGVSPTAERIHLNLAPGTVDALTVVDVLLSVLPVEAAHVMVPPDGPEPAFLTDLRPRLAVEPGPLTRQQFYEACQDPSTSVAVATGELRLYANVLLTIGVVSA